MRMLRLTNSFIPALWEIIVLERVNRYKNTLLPIVVPSWTCLSKCGQFNSDRADTCVFKKHCEYGLKTTVVQRPGSGASFGVSYLSETTQTASPVFSSVHKCLKHLCLSLSYMSTKSCFQFLNKKYILVFNNYVPGAQRGLPDVGNRSNGVLYVVVMN